MRSLYGITGTPGTGKKTVAPLVAAIMKVGVLGLNDLAKDYGLIRKDSGVDPAPLGARVSDQVRGPCVVYGHLLPYAVDRGKVVRAVVLRCDPGVLKERLTERGYHPAKVSENVEAELIGVISADCVDRFGRERVADFDTTGRTPAKAASEVAKFLMSGKQSPRTVDWMESYDSPEKLKSLLGPRRAKSALT